MDKRKQIYFDESKEQASCKIPYWGQPPNTESELLWMGESEGTDSCLE